MKKLIWALIIATMVAVLINTLIQVIIEYSRRPVDVIIKMERKTELVFPAVTFCNINPTRKSQLYKSPSLSSVFAGEETTNSRKRRNGKLLSMYVFHNY